MTRSDAAVRLEARDATFRIACVESAAQAIGRLSDGCRIVGLTKGQFSMLDLIRAVLAQTGPADLVLSTWTVGIRDIENARWLVDNGDLLSLRLLTDRSFVTRQPRYCRRLVELFGPECIRASNTHAKFALVRNDKWDIAIRGSMNLNRNARWENFDLDESPELCEFFAGLVTELEALSPPGPSPGEDVVEDVFNKALQVATCGDVLAATAGPEERLARLGYTRLEAWERSRPADDFALGQRALEDRYRESVLTAAEGGDAKAREVVDEWLSRQRKSSDPY